MRDPREVPLQPIAENPDRAALTAQVAIMEGRLAQTVARRERALQAGNAPPVKRNVLDRARDLARGGTIPSADPKAEFIAAQDEEHILRHGIFLLNQQLAELEAKLSFDACQTFLPDHVAALRKLDAAFEAAADAVKALHEIDARLKAAGYTPTAVVLPANVPRHAYQLGDPATFNGEAGKFRRWLIKTFGE
jgi:hypothetical protein